MAEPRADAKSLRKRSDLAWQRKAAWHSLMDEAYEFALPHRNLYSEHEEGGSRGDRVYDSTLTHSTIRFANRLQTDLCPPFQKWATLEPGPFLPKGIREDARRELEVIRDQAFGAIHVSNFDTAFNEMLLDLAFGTGCLLVREGPDESPIMHEAVPLAHVAFEEGPFGVIEGVYRKVCMPARSILRTWEDADLPAGLSRLVREKPDDEVNLQECTHFDPDSSDYLYNVVWTESGESGNPHVLVERAFEEMPWITPRWTKVSGEIQGRGPVLFALPDAKVLNRLRELILKNASMAVVGAYTVADPGLVAVENIRIVPGAFIPVRSNGTTGKGPSIKALESGGRFDVSQLVAEELVANIKKMLLDDQLPPDAGPVRSATEIVQRVKQLQQDVGAPFGRLMTEFVQPYFRRVLGILHRRGVIPYPVKINGYAVSLQVTSPLAQAQKINDLQSAVTWMQIVQGLGQEAFLVGVKVEDVPAWLAEKLAVDTALVRDKAERRAIEASMGKVIQAGLQQRGIGVGGGQPLQLAA